MPNPGAQSIAFIGQSDAAKARLVALLKADDSVDQSESWPPRLSDNSYDIDHSNPSALAVIDLPALSQSPEVVEWLNTPNLGGLPKGTRLSQFLASRGASLDFAAECAAVHQAESATAVFYVVDGNRPYRKHIISDLQLLSFMSRPIVVVITYDQLDHRAETVPNQVSVWASAIADFSLPIIKVDLSDGRIQARQSLLAQIGASIPALGPTFTSLANAENQRNKQQIETAAAILAELIHAATNYKVTEPIKDRVATVLLLPGSKAALTDRLRLRLEADLRKRELDAWRQIMQVFGFRTIAGVESDTTAPYSTLVSDLFSEETWTLLGLSATQLVTLTAAAGGATGAAIDASVGGASFMMGSVIGIVGGALAGTAVALSDPKPLGIKISKTSSEIGPVTHPNFRWILLDRGLRVVESVARRSHASREPLSVAAGDGAETLADKLSFVDKLRVEQSWLGRGTSAVVIGELVREALGEGWDLRVRSDK